MKLKITVDGEEVFSRDKFEEYNFKNTIHKHVLLHEIMTMLEEWRREKKDESEKVSIR